MKEAHLKEKEGTLWLKQVGGQASHPESSRSLEEG